MIPKIIHYCWFGRNPLPEMALKCIESWKRYCPDYKIIEWNEDNFDVDALRYTKEAYECKKYAFVSDVARLKALYEVGGIYMDTDCEVIRNLDEFLNLEIFSGFEANDRALTAIWGATKENNVIKELLYYYNNKHFILENGMLNKTTNVTIFTNMFLKKGLVLNGKKQTVDNFTIFPPEFFCPKDVLTKDIIITENTYTIHHFDGSWLTEEEKLFQSIKANLIKKFGINTGKFIYYIYFILKNIEKNGISKTIKLVVHKYKNKYEKN